MWWQLALGEQKMAYDGLLRTLFCSVVMASPISALAGDLDNIAKPKETDSSPQPQPQPQANPSNNLPAVPANEGVMEFGASLISNMENGFHIMDQGYKAACVDAKGVVAIARMDIYAAVNGEVVETGSPYTSVTLRPNLEFVRQDAGSGTCQLKVCLPANGATPGQDFQCNSSANGADLGLKLGDSERPTTYQEANVPYSVSGKDIKLQTKFATVSGFHPVFGFAAAGKAFKDYQSPLVLDLNGNGGFDLVDAWNSKVEVRFDMVADGAPVRTGWVKPSDGFLALDRNHNGKIDDGSELFGEYTPGAPKRADGKTFDNGFLALAQLDANHDGVIDAKDAAFKDLVIWRDLNQDGKSQGRELMSLAKAGVESISLAYHENTENGRVVKVEGNEVRLVSSFKMKNGRVGAVADIWFRQRRFADRPVASVDFHK